MELVQFAGSWFALGLRVYVFCVLDSTLSPKPKTLNARVRNCGKTRPEAIPIGSKVVPFCGLYLGSSKVTPQKELLWSPWVVLSRART